MTRRTTAAVQTVVLIALAIIGVAAAAYVLANQNSGLPLPWKHTYRIKAELTAADGVRANVGAPVNVAGVRVGQIVGVDNSSSGNAVVTMEIERGRLAHVYGNARASLEPLTPLKDMSMSLNPGAPPARPLPSGGVVDVAHTAAPVDLSTLLSSLDSDTRSALTELLTATAQGTGGQGEALRRTLVAFGPTTAQVGRLSRALADRRRELARFVSNLAQVTRAASQDGRLATVVEAGNATLQAVAREDAAFRKTIGGLPASLRSTRRTLDQAAAFARELQPTVTALQPAVSALPRTLQQVRTLSDAAQRAISSEVRPLVRQARPVGRDLGRTVPPLARLAPQLTDGLLAVTYLLNELGYNPPGDDEGELFWASWLIHNWLSMVSTGDAHGTILRAMPFVGCGNSDPVGQEIVTLINAMTGLPNLCPN